MNIETTIINTLYMFKKVEKSMMRKNYKSIDSRSSTKSKQKKFGDNHSMTQQ